MKLSESAMKNELEAHGYWGAINNPIFVIRSFGVGLYVLFGMFSIRQYIANFSDDGIYMISLSKISGKPLKDKDVVVKYSEIEKIKESTVLFGAGRRFKIKLINGKTIVLRVSKVVVGLPAQKENIKKVSLLIKSKLQVYR